VVLLPFRKIIIFACGLDAEDEGESGSVFYKESEAEHLVWKRQNHIIVVHGRASG
jgi:hypothetical protein